MPRPHIDSDTDPDRRGVVETWSFQAPGFYLKQGYREVALIEDYPPGAREHVLVKDL